MKTTKTKPLYLPIYKQITICNHINCKKRYICFINMKDLPICPYCNKKQKSESVSLLEFFK